MGVEIEITPAGKATKRLTLLSGGEKSMTALAFLFAVFLARPCPFYILDEVEAALDDLNIDRFLKVLRSFADRAQFIVVTHQKRTMEAADSLYGVSMAGNGVSKVISRKLPRAVEAEARRDESTSRLARRSSARRASPRRVGASSARAGVVGAARRRRLRRGRGRRRRSPGARRRGQRGRRRQRRRRAQHRRHRLAPASSAASATSAARRAWAASAASTARAASAASAASASPAPSARSACTRSDDPPRDPEPARRRPRRRREFYTGFLGFDVAMDEPGFTMFASPSNRTAQITVADANTPGLDRGIREAQISVEVEDVDALHAEAVRRGLEIVYPLTDEPWGIRRFFVKRPRRHRDQRRHAPLEHERPAAPTSSHARPRASVRARERRRRDERVTGPTRTTCRDA